MGVCIILFSLNDIACNGTAVKCHECFVTRKPVMQEAFLATIEDGAKEDLCTVAERLSTVKSCTWLGRDIEKIACPSATPYRNGNESEFMTKDSEAPQMRWTFPSFEFRAVTGKKPHLLKSAYAVSKRQDVIKLHPWECRIAQGVSLIWQH